MLDAVLKTLRDNAYALENKDVVIAVSGGRDSMAALHFFVRKRESFGLGSITAAHFNHGLRGEASDLDEALARSFAGRLNVPFVSGNGGMCAADKPKGHGIESWARALRYDFLKETAEKNGAYIVTAHTMNDSAETTLFHIARGTGLRGASGIPFKNGMIIRPFLGVTRGEINKYVKEHSIPFRDDESNIAAGYTRNRIRHKVLPELLRINKNAVRNIAKFSVFASEADRFFVKESEKLLESAKSEFGYFAAALLSAPAPITVYALKGLCDAHGCDVNEKQIELMLAVLRKEKRSVQLNKTLLFSMNGEHVSISEYKPPGKDVCYELPASEGRTMLPSGDVVFLKRCDIIGKYESEFALEDEVWDFLDCEKISGALIFRSRRAGDTFNSSRRNHTKSLKKLFIELKIPLQKRSLVPLLADDTGVLWIAGEGVSKRVEPSSGTKSVLGISIKSE